LVASIAEVVKASGFPETDKTLGEFRSSKTELEATFGLVGAEIADTIDFKAQNFSKGG
jgi:phage-related minor tail protein